MSFSSSFRNLCILRHTIVKAMSRNTRENTQTQGKDRRALLVFVMRAHELTTSIFSSISISSQILSLALIAKRSAILYFATQFFITTCRLFGRQIHMLKRHILNYILLYNCTILLSTKEQIWTNSTSTIFQYHCFHIAKYSPKNNQRILKDFRTCICHDLSINMYLQ